MFFKYFLFVKKKKMLIKRDLQNNIDRVKEVGKRKKEKVYFPHLYSAQSIFQRPMLENDFSSWAAEMLTKTEEKQRFPPDHRR